MATDPTAGWFDMAGRLSAEEALGAQSGTGKTALADFSRRESVTPNMLRKMQRARLYIEKNEPARREALSTLPLSYIDVLTRVSAIDSKKAEHIAAKLVENSSNFSYRKLLDIYDTIRAARSKEGNALSKNKSHVAQYKKDILAAAKSGSLNNIYINILNEFGERSFRSWKGGHEFVSPFMTSRIKKPDSCTDDAALAHDIDAFDCYLQYDEDPHELIRDRIMKGSTEATFFNRLWFVLPINRSVVYEGLIDRLGPSNFGVLRFCAQSSTFTCTRLPTEIPYPDRRNLWTSHSINYCAR